MLKLMYITCSPEIAKIAEDAGVDRVFVDLEYIGKSDRQGGMDTVQSHHRMEDIRAVRTAVSKAQVLVRVNPIHEAGEEYESSRVEIEAAIENGADILMLPYFKTVAEAEFFCDTVAGRAGTMLLVETPEAVAVLDDLLQIPGVDEIHVGLNDLSIACGHKFLFVPLADGTVEEIANKCHAAGITFGFGGIASLGNGALPSEYVVREHYRLGSEGAILSRSFCNLQKITDLDQIRHIFKKGVQDIRNLEQECRNQLPDSFYYAENQKAVADRVKAICDELTKKECLV